MQQTSSPVATADSNVTWTHVIYALHAFSLLTGILGAATVVGAFLTGWPSIIAVILNYVKRGDVRTDELNVTIRIAQAPAHADPVVVDLGLRPAGRLVVVGRRFRL